ncbi:CinA family protein [Opacimonas viscosa]|uniref:CinA family protein n=1 Tax=Opacimonas viscosa TaxID=2961944 RepID=A0AA42BKG0_9ALTE|nr:CinA family protein [Opacimonas viscosa]MCP3427733.1 CinA family protein [Opacimonas viscosa]
MTYLKENTKTALESIAQFCIEKELSVSCAESCTAGGIAYALTEIEGASSWFKESYVTYANSAKMHLVYVDEEILNKHGAVSEQTVVAMVKGCCARAAADIGISVSGIAGPGGGSEEKPVGTVWFAWSVAGEVVTAKQIFPGDRTAVRQAAIDFAITELAQQLIRR